MNKVFILGSCRTAIGKMGGSLSSLSAVELGSIVIKEALQRADIAPLNVDHVYMGAYFNLHLVRMWPDKQRLRMVFHIPQLLKL